MVYCLVVFLLQNVVGAKPLLFHQEQMQLPHLEGASNFRYNLLSGIHPEFSFLVIPDMFTYLERCPPALSVYVLTHLDS